MAALTSRSSAHELMAQIATKLLDFLSDENRFESLALTNMTWPSALATYLRTLGSDNLWFESWATLEYEQLPIMSKVSLHYNEYLRSSGYTHW